MKRHLDDAQGPLVSPLPLSNHGSENDESRPSKIFRVDSNAHSSTDSREKDLSFSASKARNEAGRNDAGRSDARGGGAAAAPAAVMAPPSSVRSPHFSAPKPSQNSRSSPAVNQPLNSNASRTAPVATCASGNVGLDEGSNAAREGGADVKVDERVRESHVGGREREGLRENSSQLGRHEAESVRETDKREEKSKNKEKERDREREREREREKEREKERESSMDADRAGGSVESISERMKVGKETEKGKGGKGIRESWERPAKGKEKDKETEGREQVNDRNGREGLKEKEVGGNSVIEDGSDREVAAIGGVPSAERSKRALRPRQVPGSREARSRFRHKDNEGTHGRSEPPVFQYREGEGMPELCKLLKETDGPPGKEGENVQPSRLAEIHIPSEALTSKNRQVRGRQLWGTDVYTDDSDIVAVLQHVGFYTPSQGKPPPTVAEVRATVRVMQPQESYSSSLRNNMRSRAWGAARGNCSYAVERCRIIKAGGGSLELEAVPLNSAQAVPTLAPPGPERTVTTRSASQNAARQQRLVPEVTVLYNLCNEPWLKYSMSVVADRGLRPSQFTSARLKRADVLYLETRSQRFELSYQGEGPPRIAGNGSGKFQGGVGNGALAEKKAEQDAHGREEERGKVGGSEAVGDKNGGREQEREGEGEAHTGEGRDKEGEKGTEGGKEKKEQNSHSRDKETERHGAEKSGGNHHHHHHHHEKALTHAHGHGHGQNHGASKEGSHGRGETTELYKWARCGSILSLAAMRAKGCPLPADSVEVLEDGISWEEIQWSPTSVFVRGREYELARAHFMPRRGPSEH